MPINLTFKKRFRITLAKSKWKLKKLEKNQQLQNNVYKQMGEHDT